MDKILLFLFSGQEKENYLGVNASILTGLTKFLNTHLIVC